MEIFVFMKYKKNKAKLASQTKLQSKIDKICVPRSLKAAFILSGGDVYFVNIPQIENPQKILKSKDIANIYVNLEEKKCEKMLLTLQNKGRLSIKIYEIDIKDGKIEINEKTMPISYLIMQFGLKEISSFIP